jgi:hypothetical protein
LEGATVIAEVSVIVEVTIISVFGRKDNYNKNVIIARNQQGKIELNR